MQLPNAVKKAAENSEAMAKQLREGKPQDRYGTTPQVGTPKDGQRETLPKKVDDQTNKPADTPQNSQTQQPKEDEETYKQRYFTLKGKFDSEVPRLQQDVRNLQQYLSDLKKENEQLMEAANNPNNKDPVNEGKSSSLDPEVFKEYGEDFGALVETIQTVQAENKTLKKELSRLSGDVSQSRESQQARVYNDYLGQVKAQLSSGFNVEFDTINSDPNFLNFLRQHAGNESEPRFAKLKKAEANCDLPSTMAIFKEYLGNPSRQNGQDNLPAPNLQPNPKNTGTDLNPPAPAASTRTWTRKSIAQFYKDKTAGMFNGREDEAKLLEQDIFLAPQQGRVVA